LHWAAIEKIAFYNYSKGGILLLILLFATMLTGPRIITGVITLQVFYFKHAEEKDIHIQCCTIIYHVRNLHAWILSAKNSLLGVVAMNARCKPHSALDPC
jgi:hypothetical protein